MEYTLINYTDVWGNEKDGWEINDVSREFNDLHIEKDATDKDILEYLKTIGFLTTSDMRKVKLYSIGDSIEIVQVRGSYPLGCLIANI